MKGIISCGGVLREGNYLSGTKVMEGFAVEPDYYSFHLREGNY